MATARYNRVLGALPWIVDQDGIADAFTSLGLAQTLVGVSWEGTAPNIWYNGDELTEGQATALHTALSALPELVTPIATQTINYHTAAAPGLTLNMGTSGNPFDAVITRTVQQLSDERMKRNIAPLGGDLGLGFLKRLTPSAYQYVDGRRVHLGVIAQDVERALGDPKYAVVCREELPAGAPKAKSMEGMDSLYTVRYEELIAPLILAAQQLDTALSVVAARLEEERARSEARDAAQEARIAALESRLATLEGRVAHAEDHNAATAAAVAAAEVRAGALESRDAALDVRCGGLEGSLAEVVMHLQKLAERLPATA